MRHTSTRTARILCVEAPTTRAADGLNFAFRIVSHLSECIHAGDQPHRRRVVMAHLLARAQKLRGRSWDEFRVRGVQAMHACLEAIGLSELGREPSDGAFRGLFDPARLPAVTLDGDALRRHFENRDARLLLPGTADPRGTQAALLRRSPNAAYEVVEHAERIVRGHVEIFGSDLRVGERPDWTREPRTGQRAPARHWSRIRYLDADVAGDCKFTWEINRHQHLLTLGRAYALTGDERYARAFAVHVASWMDANPPKRGINWTSSLEVSLRAISWLWALQLFRGSPALDARLYVRMLKFLYVHGRHLETYLSIYFSPNTHLTGEALGLLYLGLLLPELKRASTWRALGARVLVEQLARQVLPDGVYFEQSTCYHRYTTDIYLHALMLAQAHDLPLAAAVRPRLEALLDHLMYVTRPDGTTPLIGDDDGGRLVRLGERAPNDFRDTLALGAVLLERGDLAYVAREATEELVWLLGPRGLQAFEALAATPPDQTSRAFPDGGYFVMREHWRPDGDYALVRCGPHGALTGAHAHADALALELTVMGRPFLVDPGTFTYTGSREARDQFRQSAVHSTVTVDGRSSAVPAAAPFGWASVARGVAREWVTHEAFDFFAGEHDGYHSLNPPVTHTRAVLFIKGSYWVIYDRLASTGDHEVALHLHWAPDVTLHCIGDRAIVAQAGVSGPAVHVHVFTDAGRLSCEEGWVSSSYGQRSPVSCCTLRRRGQGTQEMVTVLAPSHLVQWQSSGWQRAAWGREGGVLTLATAAGVDTLVIGAGEINGGGCVSANAGWAWVRRARGGEPTQFVVIGARSLTVDGVPLLSEPTTPAHAIGWRVGDRWEIELPEPAVVSASESMRASGACAASAV